MPLCVRRCRTARPSGSVRPAFDAASPPVALAAMTEANRSALLDRVAAAPWRFAANAVIAPSAAPCLDSDALAPRPVLLRMFLVRDRGEWRAMPGGLGCVLPEGAQTWPSAGPVLAKDVWVLAENPAAIEGPRATRAAPLAIRRTAGSLPSRVADNFFWLGRYLERLEGAARLLLIAIGRISRPAPTPHEMAELEVLIDCLAQAGLLNAEAIVGLGPAGLGQALLRAAASWGAVHALVGHVSRVTGLLRDQVTAEMHTVTARGLREVEEAVGRDRPPPRPPGNGCDDRGDVTRIGVLGDAVGTGRGEHGARRRQAVPGPGPANRASRGGGRSACLCTGVPRRRAAAGAGRARAASGAGTVRLLDHLSQPLSHSATAGAGAGPDAGRRRQPARPGVSACRHPLAAERDRRRRGQPARLGCRAAGRTAGHGPHGRRSRRSVGCRAVPAGPPALAARCGGRTVGPRVPPLFHPAADRTHRRHRRAARPMRGAA